MENVNNSSHEKIIIENIVTALQGYALDDIRFNKGRPIAAAILCACLIDQMSGFVCRERTQKLRMEQFMKKYMNVFKDFDVYGNFRNPVVHNYSLGEGISVTSEDVAKELRWGVANHGVIYMPDFIEDLEHAIQKAVNALRADPAVNRTAIKWHSTHQILVGQRIEFQTFSAIDIDLINRHYSPQIAKLPSMANRPNFLFYSQLISENSYLMYIEVEDPSVKGDKAMYQLRDFTAKENLQDPLEWINGQGQVG